MKTTIAIIVSLVIFMCLCLSCGDEYTTYTSSIDNQTSDTIYISFSGNTAYAQSRNSITCLPYVNNIYYKANGRILKKIDCDPQISSDEVNIETSSGRSLKKDISDEDNWVCDGNNKDGWVMTFIVSESDIE